MAPGSTAAAHSAAMPVMGAIRHFRDEFEFHVRHKRCAVNRRAPDLADRAAAFGPMAGVTA